MIDKKTGFILLAHVLQTLSWKYRKRRDDGKPYPSNTCSASSSLHRWIRQPWNKTKATDKAPLGETTRPRPFEAPLYTVSMMSITWRYLASRIDIQIPTTHLLFIIHRPVAERDWLEQSEWPRRHHLTHILLLLPVPRSIMICLFL